MLESVELVEIFHQFTFLITGKLNDVPLRKLFLVVFDGFVHITRMHAMYVGHIRIEQDLVSAHFDE